MKGNRLLKRSAGETELGRSFGSFWNNQSYGTDGPITCEACGKVHPRREDESYTVSVFLDRQIVEECCGAILDKVYEESGETFCLAFLEEFAENPTDPRFHMLVDQIGEALKKAKEKSREIYQRARKAENSLQAIKKAKDGK